MIVTMNDPLAIKNYINFSTEDFLLDDFFISSMKNPTEESDSFWKSFLNQPETNSIHFFEAKELYNKLRENYLNEFAPEEIDRLWIKIDNIIDEKERRSKFKKIFKISLSIGAAVAAVLVAIFLSQSPYLDKHEDSIEAFVAKNINENLSNDTTIRLLVSGNQIVHSNKRDELIQYDSTDIKIGGKSIEKESAAKYNQLIVPLGKQSQVLLADGTQIWVNAGTTLTYPVEFNSDKREIYVNGEIYLNVTKDPSRPFIVHTHDFNVSVLGTSFNVSAYSGETTRRVVLVSGSVKINNSNKKEFLLKPNEKYERDDNKEIIAQTDVCKYISWKDGIYEFESEHLSSIVKYISRYFGIQIACDKNIQNLKCSGKLLIIDDINKSLKRLSEALPICIKKYSDHYQITQKIDK